MGEISRGAGQIWGAMAKGGIRACQKGEDTTARLGKPNDFTQEATGFADGVGTSGKGKPLEEHRGVIGRKGRDGAIEGVDELANERSGRLGLQQRLRTEEEAGLLELVGNSMSVHTEDRGGGCDEGDVIQILDGVGNCMGMQWRGR
jgi:hypothetical protein